MLNNGQFMEFFNAKAVTLPVDGNTAAITGTRVNMKEVEKVTILVMLAAGTGSTVALHLQQHKVATSGTPAVLATPNPYYVKSGTATHFTKIENADTAGLPGIPSEVSDIDVSTQFAADGGLLVLEVNATDLDVNNGYQYMSVNVDDTATAKILAAVYLLSPVAHNPPYDQDI